MVTTLRRLDGRMRIRDADIEILRAVPMLAILPAATIEQLGARLDHALPRCPKRFGGRMR